MKRDHQKTISNNRSIFVNVKKRKIKLIAFMKQWRCVEKYIFDIAHKVQPAVKRAKREIVRFRKRLTKMKQKRDDVLTKRNETLIDRDDANAKREKVINLLDETMTSETNEKKNDDVEFKQKKKKSINFEAVATANEKKMMMKKKILVENDDFQMFETFDVKNSTERTSTKFVIDDTTTFSSIFKNSSFDSEKFLK